MAEVYREEFRIRSYHTNYKGIARMNSILDFLYEIAGVHAQYLKMGVKELQKDKHQTWVLSRMLLELEKYPVMGSSVIIETWPKDYDRLFARRDFLIMNKDEKLIGRATTYWLLIDFITKRPQMTHMHESLLNPDRIAIKRKLEKLPAVSEIVFSGNYKAAYTDVDINKHVSSTNYVKWVLNTFPKEIMEKMQISSIELNHISEIYWGDELTVNISGGQDGIYIANIRDDESGRETFRIRLKMS